MKIYKPVAVRPFPIIVAVLTILLLLIVAPISLVYSAAEVTDSNARQTGGPVYDFDSVQATTTVFLDWGSIGWVDPPDEFSYPWVQTFTNVGGSGIDVTVTIPRQHRDFNTGYIDTLGEDIDVYTGDTDILRFWHPNDTQIDQISVCDFYH